MLSVILPTFCEGNNPYFIKNLELLSSIKGIEVIAVDSTSKDTTSDIISSFSFQVITISDQTRAARIQKGVQAATGNKILIVHPRNLLNILMIEYLKETENVASWGGFTHRFDKDHFFLNYISWYSNNIRVKRKSLVYLDHCVFLHSSLKKYVKIPSIPIFEDTVLSEQLRKEKKAELIDIETITSAVRFEKSGIYKQYVKNQIMKLGYALGISCHTLNYLYEKQLMLNTRYEK